MKYTIEIEMNCELADLAPLIFLSVNSIGRGSPLYTPIADVSINGSREMHVPIPMGYWTEQNLLYYLLWRYFDIKEGMETLRRHTHPRRDDY